MEAANVTVYRMDKDFPGGADGRLIEMAAEDMACLVAKGGVDMEIDLPIHFRNIAHDRGDFQHTGKLVGIEFLFLGVKYADNGVVGSTKADDRTGLDLSLAQTSLRAAQTSSPFSRRTAMVSPNTR